MKTLMRIEREKRGWSQQELADRVGVTRAQISRIETSGVDAAETADLIVTALGHALTLDQVCFPERYSLQTEEAA